MKIEAFISGGYKQQYQYKSFTPVIINQEWGWDDPRINTLLERATQEISELNAYSLIVPNIDLFITMHITKEANTSSRIEGTQTNIDEVVGEQDQVPPEKRDDWREVQNYIHAMNEALDGLKNFPLSNRLIRRTHATLMQSVRGENKTPGEFRITQNWIGGTNLNNAVFIPPHHDDVPALMSDLELFLHNDNIHVPHLIRIAIAHYQFETIHPFLDGNGRIGRLMITLYLVSKNFLNQPSLYVSDYLERNRGAYYDALTVVRSSNDLGHWIRFFLTAMIETAQRGKRTFQEILKLRAETDRLITAMGRRAENARVLIDHLYQHPVISVTRAAELLDITHQAANSLIGELESQNILIEKTGQVRNRIYVFERYLELFRD